MNELSIHESITPLRRIFWGGLLCVFDFNITHTVNGEGFKFDILSDVVGTYLIALGLGRLSEFHVHERYSRAMSFAKVVAILSVLNAIRDHFIVHYPAAISFLLNVFGLVRMAAIVAFCVAMRWLCEEYKLLQACRSWRLTSALFIFIYLIPLGLLYLAIAFAIATDQRFNFNTGPIGLLLLPVFALPVVHLFMSTSRMKEEAERIGFYASQFPPQEFQSPT